MNRAAYQQRRWPDTPIFQGVASRWCADQSRLLLELVWRGVDLLIAKDLSKVPVTPDDLAREESLNNMLAVRIDQCKSGDEPFAVVHQPPEQAMRHRTLKAQSPHPDIGFTYYENQNCVWPIEAKMLSDCTDLDAYANELKVNFLTGRYATYSTEGALIGYTLANDAVHFLANVAAKIGQSVAVHPYFSARPHGLSQHERTGIMGRGAESFVCHHLAIGVGSVTVGTASTGGESHVASP